MDLSPSSLYAEKCCVMLPSEFMVQLKFEGVVYILLLVFQLMSHRNVLVFLAL